MNTTVRLRTVRGWHRRPARLPVCAGLDPHHMPVVADRDPVAGHLHQTFVLRQRSPISLVNEIPAIVGCPIFTRSSPSRTAQALRSHRPRCSRRNSSLSARRSRSPAPARSPPRNSEPGRHRSLHTRSATPDGPAAAVAVTYCVPAVDGASDGRSATPPASRYPRRPSRSGLANTAAPSDASSVSGNAPWPYRAIRPAH